jgi:hypothetical protein
MKAWPDWDEFLRRLREDPVFREEVRQQVLTEDLLNLLAVVQTEFARAFRLIADLTEQVRENSRQIASLTERMDRAEAQIQENGRQIAALTKALRDFQEAAERRFAALEREVAGLRQDVGDLKGTVLEVWWAQYAPSYLGRWFRKMRVLSREALNDELEAAEDEGRLTAEDAEEVRRTDVVAVARDRKMQGEVWSSPIRWRSRPSARRCAESFRCWRGLTRW